ncbi:MAG: hypothetical protein AAF215_19615 [Cyanobacteria bacterium P01_A01_bin.123]
MMMQRSFRFLSAFCLATLLLLSACSTKTASRWEAVEETGQQQEQVAVESGVESVEPLSGSAFNQFFPPEGDGFQRIYTQEKSGFAEAKLKQDGEDLAMLSVSDTAANPTAAEKYRNSALTIGGYPAANTGSTATGVLVGDRLQVKVLSRADSFTIEDREAWIEKFDLAGLESLVQ